jgi:hypothetical protein
MTIIGIALGMQFMHENRMQLKNILLDDDFHPYIAGLGKCQCWDLDATVPQSVGITLYHARDISEEDVDSTEKVDVHSFGLMPYEIVVDNSLLEDESGALTLPKILAGGWRPHITCDVFPGVQELVERCWSVNPEKRPAFTDIVDELSEMQCKIIPGVDPR